VSIASKTPQTSLPALTCALSPSPQMSSQGLGNALLLKIVLTTHPQTTETAHATLSPPQSTFFSTSIQGFSVPDGIRIARWGRDAQQNWSHLARLGIPESSNELKPCKGIRAQWKRRVLGRDGAPVFQNTNGGRWHGRTFKECEDFSDK
jgi:hypothetical protein